MTSQAARGVRSFAGRAQYSARSATVSRNGRTSKHAHQGSNQVCPEKGLAFAQGWPASPCLGQLFCPFARRGGCIIRVFSTPRKPENHARRIREEVDSCPHA